MIALVIHGGAGAISSDLYSEEELKEYKNTLSRSLQSSYSLLEKGATAIDAVSQAVRILEDCPMFNSGRGSVLCSDGRVQMDASIMCGKTLNCGAVTLVEEVKNPIMAARLVMERTPHRMLGSKDADQFARENGLDMATQDYFKTRRRVDQLIEAQKHGEIKLDHDGDDSHTVGAVALDAKGNLAAATSTGGLTNKMPGRVSDSSIIGAGTFAHNETLAISATGTGDVFIQNVSCYDAHALMAYGKANLSEACSQILAKVHLRDGTGGVIAVTRAGEVFMGFNSGGMFRGAKTSQGREEVEIF